MRRAYEHETAQYFRMLECLCTPPCRSVEGGRLLDFSLHFEIYLFLFFPKVLSLTSFKPAFSKLCRDGVLQPVEVKVYKFCV